MFAAMPSPSVGRDVEVRAPREARFDEILTSEAREFVARLARGFEARRRELLRARADRQRDFDAGAFPTFLESTAQVRDADWRVAPIPHDLLDRRVEITGPVDRKMVINALNSGAQVYMADFEDSHSPTWRGTIEGQINLRDAVAGTIEFKTAEKHYTLNPTVATLIVRPRGWHLVERHVLVDGEPVSGSLFDFGVFFFHNAKALIAKGSGPYFYLPKLESHLEARLWNDVFIAAQDGLGIPRGTIRATVLIETIPAAFEMDEILYELRDHAAGLNCGRWDYIFSFIKKFRSRPEFVLRDRARVTKHRPFLQAYVDPLIHTRRPRGRNHRGRPPHQRGRRDSISRVVAARRGLRADLQPDGGRRHRRNLAVASVAVGPSRSASLQRAYRDARSGRIDHHRGDGREESERRQV